MGITMLRVEVGNPTLLGVLTLEALGYALDPLRRELRPLPMLLGTIASGANA